MPPNFVTSSITSLTEPPVVITSSITSILSFSLISKPLRIHISPFFLSAKIVLTFNSLPTSVPSTMPPMAGEITASMSLFMKLFAILCANRLKYFGYCKTFAH